MVNYLAVVHKEADRYFGVPFPDFPGFVTAGAALEEAKDMALDALSLHVKGLLEDGEPMPAPFQKEEVLDNRDYSDAAAVLVLSVCLSDIADFKFHREEG